MTLTTDSERTPRSTAPRVGGRRRAAALVGSALVVVAAMVLSLMVGNQALPPLDVLRELVDPGSTEARDIVRGLRMDRTLIALIVGLALGAAGALMQALTRNPLADPGLLGVNAGAAAAVVSGIAFLDITTPSAQIWFAFAGAAAASVAVYVLGSGGQAATTPVRLALAGAALSAVLLAYMNGVALASQPAFDTMRFWLVGSVTSREISILATVWPFLAVGFLIAFAVTPGLNALGLGEDAGRALGVSVGRMRLLTALSITLLCGIATAMAGPIVFLGLVLPHVARYLVGPDQRWILPIAMLLSAALLLVADTLGRVVIARELEAGIMTALIGAPLFIAMVRRRRLAHL